MTGTPAARPGGSERQNWNTSPAPAESTGSQLVGGLRPRCEPSPPSARQIKHDVDEWAEALMALAARLGPPAMGQARAATPELGLSVACLTESTVVACALDLQRLAVVMEMDLRQRDQLTLELLEAQRDLHQARLDLVESRVQGQHTRCASSDNPLIELPNRTSFEERARRALAWHESEARELGLLYIDLDQFKAINELHGQAVGDELLTVIAARLTATVRREDWVSRHGGDVFLCLLVEIQSEQQLVSTGQRLFDAVAAPCQIGRLALSVTPSIGIALYPHHGTTVEALLASADAAVIWAKEHRLGHAFLQPVAAGRLPTAHC